MSSDGNAESEALLTILRGFLDGRVHEGVPDDEDLDTDEKGNVLTYLVVTFLEPYPYFQDRSLAGEEVQPMTYPATVEVWSTTARWARQAAGQIRQGLIGVQLTENSSQLRLAGGGNFRAKDSAGRPTRFARMINLEMIFNLATANPTP